MLTLNPIIRASARAGAIGEAIMRHVQKFRFRKEMTAQARRIESKSKQTAKYTTADTAEPKKY